MDTLSRAARRASLLFSRNPLVRPADRVLSALFWVVTLGVLAIVPVAAATGSVVHAQRAASAQVEQRTRFQVPATLREDAPAAGAAKDSTARAWWHSPDGRLHLGDVVAPTGLHAGATTPIWVDQSGAVVGQPRTATSAIGDGVVIAMAILAGACIGFGGLHWLVRMALLRQSRRAWERQWRAVEPRWTGRRGREPA